MGGGVGGAGMEQFEQKQLLERINREGATVGAAIPEEISVQGEDVELREFVFEVKRRDGIPPGEAARVEEAKRNLRRERLQRKQRLVDDWPDLSYEAGDRVAESIIGIDRALAALDGLEADGSLEAEAAAEAAADRKRWMSFLRQVLGRDDTGGRSGGRGRGRL